MMDYLLRRMSPDVAPSSGWRMSAISPLIGDKQTSGDEAKNDASDPKQSFTAPHNPTTKC